MNKIILFVFAVIFVGCSPVEQNVATVVPDETSYEERVCEEIMVDASKVNPILYNKLDEALKYLSIYQGEK